MNEKTELTLKIFARRKGEEIGKVFLVLGVLTVIFLWAFLHFDLIWDFQTCLPSDEYVDDGYNYRLRNVSTPEGMCMVDKTWNAIWGTIGVLFVEIFWTAFFSFILIWGLLAMAWFL